MVSNNLAIFLMINEKDVRGFGDWVIIFSCVYTCIELENGNFPDQFLVFTIKPSQL